MAKLLTITNPLKLREEDEIGGGGGESYTPLELFKKYVERKYQVGDEDNETLQWALELIENELKEKEKQDQVFAAIKLHPRIINESVRYDSASGVQSMLGVSMDEAQKLKETFYKLKEIING